VIDVVSRYGLDMGGQRDSAPGLAAMAAEIAALFAAKKPLPRLVFPEGILSFSAWPDLAYDNLQIVAEGECRLKPMGNASIVFDASLRNPISAQPGNTYQPNVGNMLFEGFAVYPVLGSVGGPVLAVRGIHRSKLSARVQFSGPGASGRAAIQMTFCIITELHPVVGGGGANPVGVLLDAWPGKPNLQSTASTIWNPCLEGCSIGIDMASAGSCAVYNGTIESCGLGVHLGAASGNNTFYSVEMEGNGSDVQADGGAHGNGFLYCGNSGKLNTNFGFFSSNWAKN
jgi:hypothetical protein